jgi:3-dehydroquinate synthase
MICESYISHQEGLISESELSEISSYIISLYPININLTTISTELIKIMGHDKKNVSGQTLFSLITSIGDSTYDVHVDNDIIIKALGYYDSAILK